MTIKELYEFGVKNNLVDAEILYRTGYDGDTHAYLVEEVMEKEKFLEERGDAEESELDRIKFIYDPKDYSPEQKFVVMGRYIWD